MKKLSLLLGLIIIASVVAPALAESQTMEGVVMSTAAQPAEFVAYHRYYTPSGTAINPNGQYACANWDAALNSCKSTWKKGGYRGYLEDAANFDGNLNVVYTIVWDLEKTANAEGHTGYYYCSGKTVTATDTYKWDGANCVGPNAGACLGQGTVQNAEGKEIPLTTQGTITPLAGSGFRPIPVPMPSKATNGVIPLTWSVANCEGEGGPVRYDLYYAVNAASCAAPKAADLKFLRTVTGNSANVDVKADLGSDSFDPSAKKCITFALKLRYQDAKTVPVTSLFFSANSQGVAFGGIAATVTNLAAKYLGQNNVEVTWKTALEDGVQSFVVKRALLPNGPYQVVGTVPAKGQASNYSFIDSIQVPAGRVTTSGLYYKVETLDVDNNATAFGPVKAQLPVSTNRPVIIKEKPARKVQR